jgi:site-specific recombinase XerD
MKDTSLLKKLLPINHTRYSGLPILGMVLEDFAQWLQAQSYAQRSIRGALQGVHAVVHWLRRRKRIACTAEITPEVLAAAEAHFRPKEEVCSAGRVLHRFLCERKMIPAPKQVSLSPSQAELNRYAMHLREVRGLAEVTISGHRLQVRRFLEFIGFDRKRRALPRLKHDQIEAFVRLMARTHNRYSLHGLVLTLRSFLRFEFSQGALRRPLHEQIDTPRIYAGERLPTVLNREQVQTLLRSIDWRSRNGLRDFTMLYLIAVFGLRRSDIVSLRLDNIDWRNGILHVRQAKTRRPIALPLSDEAGGVLARYLRRARPLSERRELFLRTQAPAGPLTPWAVNVILQSRLQRGGLDFGKFGPHALRYSLAVHLLRRGVAVKSISEALGHRDCRSTAQYLRLDLDDLRAVGLPVPEPTPPVQLLTGDWQAGFPRVRIQLGPQPRADRRFRSAFGQAIERFITTRRTLGRKFVAEEDNLRAWDAFLQRKKAKTMDRTVFDQWARSIRHLHPKTQANQLYSVRGFLAYYAREHPTCFVPDVACFPTRPPRRLPRLVSAAEMSRLLAAATQLLNRKSNPARAQTVQMGLTLLFCCGLRAGELLRLRLQDYEAADQLLRIRDTKFNKSRLVPLSPSVAQALEHYMEQRRRDGVPAGPESILMWSGRRPGSKSVFTLPGFTEIWKRLCLSVGVIDERGRPPRIHDLRHSFAVAALQRWYEQDENVQARLPHLSTYLGHVGPAASHYYLHLTPALRSAASKRFHHAFGHSEGGAL